MKNRSHFCGVGQLACTLPSSSDDAYATLACCVAVGTFEVVLLNSTARGFAIAPIIRLK
ncbi:MAG: hypothetical protein U7123_13355 [Potamolinea sp.]